MTARASPPSAPTNARNESQPWRWRLIALITTYLPLLLMGLLALGTWWLMKNMPEIPDARSVLPLRHEPDYEMHKFAVQRFTAQGPLEAQIEGDVLRHYPDTDTLEVDNAHIRAINPDGRVTVASARHAIVNGTATEVQLIGGAEVLSEATGEGDSIQFRSDHLHAFLDVERVRSRSPVHIIKGNAELHADNMEYSHRDQVIQFNGHLRATMRPKAPTTEK